MSSIAVSTKTGQTDVIWSPNQSQIASDVHPFCTIEQDRAILEEEDLFHWALLQMYGNQLLQATDGPAHTTMKTLPERLAALLIYFGKEENGQIQNLSHQTLADSVDAQRETVAAILRSFSRQGFVRLGYRQIEIVDADALAELAED